MLQYMWKRHPTMQKFKRIQKLTEKYEYIAIYGDCPLHMIIKNYRPYGNYDRFNSNRQSIIDVSNGVR